MASERPFHPRGDRRADAQRAGRPAGAGQQCHPPDEGRRLAPTAVREIRISAKC